MLIAAGWKIYKEIESARGEKELQDHLENQIKTKASILKASDVVAGVTLSEDDADVHAIMAKTIPKLVIMQSSQNNKYLHCYKERPLQSLRFTGDYSFDLDTRFELVPATTETGLFHIRSLLNNKYWTKSGHFVSAMAVKPEENKSAVDLCTLFQPVFLYSNNNRVAKLRHVSSGKYAKFLHSSGGQYGLMSLNNKDDNHGVFTFIDWKSVVVLPDVIRIKGDNKKHLKAYEGGFVDFRYEADKSKLFEFEVFPSRDGGICLKSREYGTYLTEMDTAEIWVWLTKTPAHDINTVFIPIILDRNRIVLRSLRNGMFCMRNTAGNKGDCLASVVKQPHQTLSIMEIEEPVIRKTIDNLRYNFSDARRYNEKIAAIVTDDCTNRTSETITSSFNIETSVTDTTTWTFGVNVKTKVEVSFTASVPKVSSIGFKASTEISGSLEKVNEEVKVVKVGKVETIQVGKGQRVKASTVGTRLSYEIPYSYTQYNEFENGDKKTVEKHDGLLIGNGGYGYDTKTEVLPLEPFPQELLSLE